LSQKQSAGEQEKINQLKGAMVLSEERAVGSVPFKVYKEYFAQGGCVMVTITFSCFFLSILFRIAADL
jgi:hypothetical protein